MKHIDPDPLDRAVSVMSLVIGRIADGAIGAPSDDGKAELTSHLTQLERYARTIAVHIKVIAEIEAHNQQLAARSEAEKYISYEDLPPPNPSERERVIKRVLALAARLETRAGLSETSLSGPPQ